MMLTTLEPNKDVTTIIRLFLEKLELLTEPERRIITEFICLSAKVPVVISAKKPQLMGVDEEVIG